MLALKIIGGIIGAMAATIVVMFVYFFVQAADEIKNCKLLSFDRITKEQAYQCPDGIHYQPHR